MNDMKNIDSKSKSPALLSVAVDANIYYSCFLSFLVWTLKCL